MDNSIRTECAYHESGRVVFAYLSGYTCNSLQLSDTDAGQGTSMLNGGADNAFIQPILEGKSPGAITEKEKATEVAIKLIAIYTAGTCAKAYYTNGLQLSSEIELDFPHQDLQYIERLQAFLTAANPGHPANYPNQVVNRIFTALQQKEVWKAIDKLAVTAVESEIPLTRYYIEDALMAGGLKVRRPTVESGYQVGLSETPDEVPAQPTPPQPEKPATETPTLTNTTFATDSPLDAMLGSFLRKIKPEWQGSEVDAAITHLKGIFQKYGN